MIFSGLHVSLDEPPNTSMFVRAGGYLPKKRNNDVTEALTRVADRVSGMLSPASSTISKSPARLIENRSKCYRQLSELNSLRSAGVLSDSEYKSEKDCVMETLRQLQKCNYCTLYKPLTH